MENFSLPRIMQVGVFTVILGSMKLEPALDYLVKLGVQAVEIGAGGYAGTAHCDVDALLAAERKAGAWHSQITVRRLKLSSWSCHGNPLHTNTKIAEAQDLAFRKAVRLASMLMKAVLPDCRSRPGPAPAN